MSHNTNKVNAQEPNLAGTVSQSLSDLSDVSSTSPTADYYLEYSGSEWAPATGTSGSTTTAQHIWIGQGASQTYPEAWADNNGAYFYSTSVVNTITSASVSSTDTYSNWYDKITLPSGTYFAYARVDGDFSSSSGELRYLFESTPTGGGAAVEQAASGWSASSANTGQNPDVAQSLFELSAEADVIVKIKNTASIGTESTNQGVYGFLFILKVS